LTPFIYEGQDVRIELLDWKWPHHTPNAASDR
jgi:hypothetical protein